MHHRPSTPPLSARIAATLSRWTWRLGRGLRLRGRIAPAVLVCGVVAGIALTIPVLRPVTSSFADTAAGLDASSSARETTTGRARTSDGGAGTTAGSEPADDAVPTPAAAPPAPAATETTTEEPPPAPETTTAAPAPETTEETTTAPAPETSAEPSTAAAAPAPADPGVEGQVLTLVNQQRASAGCAPVVADGGLAALARAFSADMRDRGFFSHTDPDGLSPFDRGDRAGVTVMAENIAYGQPDAATVMTDWMNSPGHRANILNCSYSRLGVGVAYGPGGPWWTQDFA